MLEDGHISALLRSLGYTELSRRAFRAGWSADEVQHIIYYRWLRPQKSWLEVGFGIRNGPALSFSLHEARKYIGEPYLSAPDIGSHETFPMFPLGLLAGWRRFDALDMNLLGRSAALDALSLAIRCKLVPKAKAMLTLEGFYAFLTSNDDEKLWMRANPILRAAHIAYIGRLLRIPGVEVLQTLLGLNLNLQYSLPAGLLREDFLERTVSDAGID